MHTRDLMHQMFASAREVSVEGILLHVPPLGEGIIRFVQNDEINTHAVLPTNVAHDLLAALKIKARLDLSVTTQEQEGQVIVAPRLGRPQYWKIFVIPDGEDIEVLLRFLPGDPAEAMVAVSPPLKPLTLVAARQLILAAG